MNPLSLFRVLIPSWRFFEEPEEIYFLKHRSGKSPDALGEWVETFATPRMQRRPWHLFLNAENNLRAAAYTTLSQLAENPKSPELSAFIERFLRAHLRAQGEPDTILEWKLCVDLPTEDGRYVEREVLTS